MAPESSAVTVPPPNFSKASEYAAFAFLGAGLTPLVWTDVIAHTNSAILSGAALGASLFITARYARRSVASLVGNTRYLADIVKSSRHFHRKLNRFALGVVNFGVITAPIYCATLLTDQGLTPAAFVTASAVTALAAVVFATTDDILENSRHGIGRVVKRLPQVKIK